MTSYQNISEILQTKERQQNSQNITEKKDSSQKSQIREGAKQDPFLGEENNQKVIWSEQQEKKLIQKHREMGNKWALISHNLNNKNDNCVKNHFYSRLRKMIRKLNRIIQVYFKRTLKTFPNTTIYKLVQVKTHLFAGNLNGQPKYFFPYPDVISKMLTISIDQENKPQSCLNIQPLKLAQYKELIQQIYSANKNYKKKSKKIKNSTIKAPIRTKKNLRSKQTISYPDQGYPADQSESQSEMSPRNSIMNIPPKKQFFHGDLLPSQYAQNEPNPLKSDKNDKKVQIKEGDEMQQLLKNIGLLHEGNITKKQNDDRSEMGNQSIKSFSDFQNQSESLSFLDESNNCWKKETKMFARINRRLFGGSSSEIEGL